MTRKLTAKQKLFIEYYIIHRNGTKAAELAGYSEKSARFIGSENLTKPNIRTAIDEKLEELTLKANEVLMRLSDMATADIADFMDITTVSGVINLHKAKERGKTHLIKKIKQETITTTHKDGTESERHKIELELYNARQALVDIGRYYKLFTDRIETDYDWRSDIVQAIRDSEIDYQTTVSEFGENAAQELFAMAGVKVAIGVD